MTTIITRLYPDATTAQAVVAALAAKGHTNDTIDVITSGDAAGLKAARVSARAAAAYGPALTGGRALVVVRAPFAPIGTARSAMRIVNATPSIKVGLDDEDEYIREDPEVIVRDRVLPPGTFFMSNPHRSLPRGHILGSDPITHGRRANSAISGGAYISTKFWPMRLVSKGREARSAIRGGWLASSMFGIPTVIRDWGPRDIKTIL
jgi:hypothetical protein